MELFPIIQPQAAGEAYRRELPLYRECAWDFNRGRPLLRAGEPVVVSGRDAVAVWAWKALMTERARYAIYSWEFGSEVESLIGQNYTGQLKQAEAARYVREALEANPYIERVSGVSVDFADGKLSIAARVQTVYGEVQVNV